MKERLAKLLADPLTMDTICGYVANGGTLITLCETWDVRYSDVLKWVYANEERTKNYHRSLNDRGEWGVECVLKELRLLGLADIRQIFNEDGSILPVGKWPEGLARAVASIEVFEEYEGRGEDRHQIGWTKRVKFWDKTKAIELLGKNLGIFVDRVKHEGKISLEDLILEAARGKKEEEKKA